MFNDEHYLRIVDSYKTFKSEFNKQKATGMYDKHYLMKKETEFRNALNKDLNDYYNNKILAAREKQQEVKKKYEVLTYENPQAEILRRQDIERKLKLMDNHDLKDIVREIKEGDNKGRDSFYFDALQIELMSRGLDEEKIILKAYRNAYNVDTPWNEDDEYIAAAEEMMNVNSTRNSGLLWEGEGKDKVVHSINSL